MKIIVCWNECKYAELLAEKLEKLLNELSKKTTKVAKDNKTYSSNNLNLEGLEVFLCQNKSTFNNIDWHTAKYVLVLCEMTWSHETENGRYSDMNGIKLVQHLRLIKKVKIPVLFLSLLGRSDILKQKEHAEKEIISTRALQHVFADVLEPVEKWVTELESMRDLTDTELEYSYLYCQPSRMLAKIRHDQSQYNTIPLLLEQIGKIERILNVYDFVDVEIETLKNIKNKLNDNTLEINIAAIQKKIAATCYISEENVRENE